MEDGVSLFLVPKDTPGLTITVLPTIDETRKLCEVRLDNVALPARGLARRKAHGLGAVVAGRRARHGGAVPPRCAAARSRCST